MSQPQRTLFIDSANNTTRKRVCKACDRCRMKKSKCAGSHPCTKCKADNAICVFGERKKNCNKVYPKGYVEMLEQQQERLVSALQEMYHRSRRSGPWPIVNLDDVSGQPLTHDILVGLGMLQQDGVGKMEQLEEPVETMQSKLLASGPGFAHRKGSISSKSDHSHPSPKKLIPQGTPVFTPNWSFSPSRSQSPLPRQSIPYPPVQPSLLQHLTPLSNNSNDHQLFQPEWAGMAFAEPRTTLRSNFAITTARGDDTLDNVSELLANAQWSDYDFSMNVNYSYQYQ